LRIYLFFQLSAGLCLGSCPSSSQPGLPVLLSSSGFRFPPYTNGVWYSCLAREPEKRLELTALEVRKSLDHDFPVINRGDSFDPFRCVQELHDHGG
jgi:hypothetical protein